MESKTKSIRGNTGSFVITDGHLTCAYATRTKDQFDSAWALNEFCHDVGIPMDLKTDRAAAFVGAHSVFTKLICKKHINFCTSEPERANELYKVDIEMRELRCRLHTKFVNKNIPRHVWCFGLEHEAELTQFLPRGNDGRSGYEIVTGNTPDISEYCDFDFWDLVWYFPKKHPSTDTEDRQLA